MFASAAVRTTRLAGTAVSVLRPSALLHTAVRASAAPFKAPVRDIKFVLNEVLKSEKHFAKVAPSLTTQDVADVIDNVTQLSEEVLLPLNSSGDEIGCIYNPKDCSVKTPKGWKEAYKQYAEAGWTGLTVPEEFGGQGLPLSVGLIKSEIIGTANWSFGMYPGLSVGCINTLLLHGSDEQKKTYLPKLSDGSWTGTMCLTEPQCGSDLAQCEAKAVAVGDGTFKLNGTKIFISAGEHDLSDNIIHIVLAKLPGAEAGTRGISLFLVPKFLINKDGTLSKKQNIRCGGIEHKMGIKASATAEMVFEDSIGYMIGQEGHGLKYMFTFMNTARIGTAIQGIAAAEAAYQGALSRALERTSMRSVSGKKDADKPADRIIHHGDVRKMLLTAKSIAEGGRCFLYDVAMISDRMLDPKVEVQKQADEEMALFTPILKGFLTELGVESASHGMQVWGGHGFIKGNGMEQIYRDARIGTMYEGTTTIQALDLLGRKILLGKGKYSLVKFNGQILSFCKKQLIDDFQTNNHKKYALQLAGYATSWLGYTAVLMGKAAMDREVVASAATDYLMYSGYITLAYYWLRMMDVAQKKLKKDPTGPDADFYRAKLATGKFYFERMLPRTKSHASGMMANPSSLMQMRIKEFSA